MTGSGTYENDTHRSTERSDLEDGLELFYSVRARSLDAQANRGFAAAVSAGTAVPRVLGVSPLEGWLETAVIAPSSTVVSTSYWNTARNESNLYARIIDRLERDLASHKNTLG